MLLLVFIFSFLVFSDFIFFYLSYTLTVFLFYLFLSTVILTYTTYLGSNKVTLGKSDIYAKTLLFNLKSFILLIFQYPKKFIYYSYFNKGSLK